MSKGGKFKGLMGRQNLGQPNNSSYSIFLSYDLFYKANYKPVSFISQQTVKFPSNPSNDKHWFKKTITFQRVKSVRKKSCGWLK